MTDHPINTVFVDGVPVAKSNVRGYEKTRNRLRADDANWVRGRDLTDAFGVDIKGRPFDLDLTDLTTADDGFSCIVDAVGNRFKIVDATSFIAITVDSGGGVLSTGIKMDLSIPEACRIKSWRLLADQSGSIVVDLWKTTFAGYPPNSGNSITGVSAKPTLTSAIKGESSVLTGWSPDLAAGDTIRVNVNSVTTINRVTLTLNLIKT